MVEKTIQLNKVDEILEALPKDIRKVLVDVSSKIIECEEVCFIMLYGSYAKGTWNPDSDIDMAVFLRDNVKDMYYFYKKFNRMTMKTGFDFQIQVFNQSEAVTPEGIVEEIVMYGIRLNDSGDDFLGEQHERTIDQ